MWPIASSPRRPESFCSSKTCVTSPRSRSAVSRPFSETAIPADSWPRCWSACRPKYVSRATSRPGARMPKTPHIRRSRAPRASGQSSVGRRGAQATITPPPNRPGNKLSLASASSAAPRRGLARARARARRRRRRARARSGARSPRRSRTSSAPSPRSSTTRSPRRQRDGIARDVGDEPDAADDRRRRDRDAAGLVVERDVARDDRDAELVAPRRRCRRSRGRAPSRSRRARGCRS